MRERPDDLLQGLELLVMVLLARNRQPPPTVTAGVPHAELAAELITLPSGLLAMVCEAVVKRKVRRWAACACVRSFVRACVRASLSERSCVRVSLHPWAIGEGRRGPDACAVPVRVAQGQRAPLRVARPCA